MPISDLEIQQLAISKRLFGRLVDDWALYPDHVVFLGPKAFVFDHIESFVSFALCAESMPQLIFIRGVGVFGAKDFSEAHKIQLKCYYDVINRQGDNEKLNSLSETNINKLVNWDAEIYRISISM